MRPARPIPAAALLLAAALTLAVSRAPADDEADAPTVEQALEAIPESEPGWHCPLARGGKISQANNGTTSHNDEYNRYAWDYLVPPGTVVVATRTGVVESTELISNLGARDAKYRDDSNKIILRHSDGKRSRYIHLSKSDGPARVGEVVLRGEHIGFTGDTGFVSAPHLHFAGHESGPSVPIEFADHPANEGVPQEGAFHGPAQPPDVPQKAITAHKLCYRAARAAHERGWPDIGLSIVARRPDDKKHADYYYARVNAAYERAFLAEARAKIEELLAAEALTLPQLLVLRRYRTTLKKERELKKLLADLAAKEKDAPEEVRDAAKASRLDIGVLVKAMLAECTEDPKTLELWAAVCKKAGDSLQAELAPEMQRAVEQAKAPLLVKLARLQDEAGRAPSEDRAAVLADAEEVTDRLTAIATLWRSHVPADAAAAKELAASAKTARDAIEEKLGK